MENQVKRCMGCMNPLPEDGRSSCGICGYPVKGQNPQGYLPVGTALSDSYVCGRALSVSGDATLYIGWDQSAKQPVYIREYLPTTLCRRTETNALEAQDGKELSYEGLRQSFLQHARQLARGRELNVLMPIYDIFEQNGTAYTVGEYTTGTSLKNYVAKNGGRLSWMETRKLFLPFLTAVSAAHAAGIYHFGISPDTILIGADGKLRLTGFTLPEARKTGSDLDPQLMSGFGAPEQYTRNASLSATTDVYGLGATLFWMLSGVTPPDGAHRDPDGQDLMMSEEIVNELPEDVTAALVSALAPAPMDRLSTVEDLRDALGGVATVEKIAGAGAVVRDENYLPKKFRWIFSIVILLLLVVILLLGLSNCNGSDTDDGEGTQPTTEVTLPTMATNAPIADGTDTRPATNLVGKNLWELEGKAESFTVEMESMIFNNAAPGTILVQEPKAGEDAVYGGTIRVIISAGPKEMAVPDVSGWTEELATQYLKALGFRVERVEISVSDFNAGEVDSTDPEQGKTASYGETITLRVSNVEQPEGPGEVVVPDVSGISEEIAVKVLKSLGLEVKKNEIYTRNELNIGLVRSTSIRSGTTVEVGTEIVLNVYVGDDLQSGTGE